MRRNIFRFVIAVAVSCVCAVPHPSFAGTTAASTVLTELDEADRTNARIEVELYGNVRSTDHDRANTAEQLWMAGDYTAALSMIRQLEDSVGVGIGIAWKVAKSSDSPRFVDDVRLGTRLDATMVALDFDAASENLFAVVHCEEATAGWAVYISTDKGTSWAETYWWTISAWADGVVAGDWFWVGYQVSGDLTDGRIRRFSLADGSADAVFGYETVVDLAIDIDEIVLFSNVDQFNNRIFFTFIASDGTMRLFWDDSSSGTTFAESFEPSPITNAASGLDWHWNAGTPLDRYSWTSYLGNDGAIHVWRWDNAGWNEMDTVANYSGDNGKTKISAHADNVIVAFEEEDLPERHIVDRISYNGGESWSSGDLTPGGNCSGFDVTARGGIGTAAIYGNEVGEPDEVNFISRANYAAGSWTDPEVINQHDILTGAGDMEVNWLGKSYGVLYTDAAGMVWFDRLGKIFSDGFESGNTSAWTTTIP